MSYQRFVSDAKIEEAEDTKVERELQYQHANEKFTIEDIEEDLELQTQSLSNESTVEVLLRSPQYYTVTTLPVTPPKPVQKSAKRVNFGNAVGSLPIQRHRSHIPTATTKAQVKVMTPPKVLERKFKEKAEKRQMIAEISPQKGSGRRYGLRYGWGVSSSNGVRLIWSCDLVSFRPKD